MQNNKREKQPPTNYKKTRTRENGGWGFEKYAGQII